MAPVERSEVVYFSSGAGVYHLSNLTRCELRLDGDEWTSLEHWYQATKFVPKDRRRFAKGGDLADLDAFRLHRGIFVKRDKEERSMKHWGANKKKPEMVGIVAKMASNPSRAQRLGLRMLPKQAETADRIPEMIELFRRGLHAKFAQNPEMRAMLLATGDKRLVEFGRGAERETKKGNPPLWNGMWVESTKEVVGRNLMGEIMMQVRDDVSAA